MRTKPSFNYLPLPTNFHFAQRVTASTPSDFGRTLPSSLLGRNHGWGSHYLGVGGAVKGQRTYGTFPALVVGGPNDSSTGRRIHTVAVDQFAATTAKWFGVDSSNKSHRSSNLSRFSTPDLGFMG